MVAVGIKVGTPLSNKLKDMLLPDDLGNNKFYL